MTISHDHPAPEYILCAAIHVDDKVCRVHLPKNIKTGLVFAGFMHHYCFPQISAVRWPNLPPNGEQDARQGFLTSHNRFVDRMEAAQIAFAAGQIPHEYVSLNSEDLYGAVPRAAITTKAQPKAKKPKKEKKS